MTSLEISPTEQAVLLGPSSNSNVSSYRVSQKKGNISGVSVSVSGAGAWAKMSSSFTFHIRNLETSRTYQQMKSSYSIAGGVHGFWAWLGFGSNASTHKEQINQMFHEVQQSQEVTGRVNVDLTLVDSKTSRCILPIRKGIRLSTPIWQTRG